MRKSILVLLFLFPIFLSAQTLKGKVVRVSDGDTVVLLDADNTQQKIRLNGIDAPENGQPYGDKSKEYLSGLIAGKEVAVEVKGKDQYKRILGVVYLGDTNINAEMIRAGYAWNSSTQKINTTSSFRRKPKQRRKGFGKIRMQLIRCNGGRKKIIIINYGKHRKKSRFITIVT